MHLVSNKEKKVSHKNRREDDILQKTMPDTNYAEDLAVLANTPSLR